MIPKHIQKILINLLPDIELYHGKKIHDKVISNSVKTNNSNQFDFYSIIPKGEKCIVWFREYKQKEYIYIYHLDTRKGKIKYVDVIQNKYHEFLTTGKIGTILYGTFTQINNIQYFVSEDICYYKSISMKAKFYTEKFKLIDSILKDINIQLARRNNIVFCKPFISKDLKYLKDQVLVLKYPVYSIQYYKGPRFLVNNQHIHSNNNVSQNKTFTIKADLQDDIYHLYQGNSNIGLACIPDYKTSIYMNNIFRKIKENIDLDYLEESDDEEEFEDISLDKYVDLEKEVRFECKYHQKFRMWVPVKKI